MCKRVKQNHKVGATTNQNGLRRLSADMKMLFTPLTREKTWPRLTLADLATSGRCDLARLEATKQNATAAATSLTGRGCEKRKQHQTAKAATLTPSLIQPLSLAPCWACGS